MLYAQIAYYVIGSIIAIIGFAVGIIQYKKTGNAKKLIAFSDYLQELIVIAEQKFGNGKGDLKRDDVVTKATLYAMQNKIKITQDEIVEKTNNIVNTTNMVNTCKEPRSNANIEAIM